MKMAVKIACLVMVVVLVMGGLGFLFGTLINNAIDNKHDAYSNAIQAKTSEEFVEAINNKQNVIASDVFVANELVTHDDLDGEYAFIRVNHYQKVLKTRVVTYSEGGKMKTRTETYYDWNFMSSKTYHGDSFEFMGYSFNYDQVELPERHLKEYEYDGFSQDVFYVVDSNVAGTMFVEFNDNGEIETKFYDAATIDEVINNSNNKIGLIIFAVIWGLITIALCWFIGYKSYWDWF